MAELTGLPFAASIERRGTHATRSLASTQHVIANVLDVAPADRVAVLDTACSDDPELRSTLNGLLLRRRLPPPFRSADGADAGDDCSRWRYRRTALRSFTPGRWHSHRALRDRATARRRRDGAGLPGPRCPARAGRRAGESCAASRTTRSRTHASFGRPAPPAASPTRASRR